jgi:hypothetical protein
MRRGISLPICLNPRIDAPTTEVSSMKLRNTRRHLAALVGLTAAALATPIVLAHNDEEHGNRIEHVLLISVDGMHEVDLERYLAAGHAKGGFARLVAKGIQYTNASSARPSDSFPGLMAFMTGGSSLSHGIFYDDSYDRTLFPIGSACKGTPGAEAQYAENIDYDLNKLDGGGSVTGSTLDHINPANLPLRIIDGKCVPVYPHDFLKVNTIMEVIHASGRRTAWSDKHPAYEIVGGPSGQGLDELYAPEINSKTVAASAPTLIPTPAAGDDWTKVPSYTRVYDDFKVMGVLNQIKGYDHTGTGKKPGVPAIFGMNFQAVSVGQKVTADGYTDALGTSSAELLASIEFVDHSLGKMLDALAEEKLLRRTLVIVGAKHGQSPIDVGQLHMLKGSSNPKVLAANKDVVDPIDLLQNGGVPVAQETADDVSLIWLADQTKLKSALALLEADQAGNNTTRIQRIYSGEELKATFGDPALGRAPDIIIQPIAGTIYSGSAKKIAEHGGFSVDDTHVMLVVSNPRLEAGKIHDPVANKQVAPTILKSLGLNPKDLQAVRMEHTRVLPGLDFED